MKTDIVLISTHDLDRAGALRRAFSAAGYGTDLVTSEETLDLDDAVLLVLTGGQSADHANLLRQARATAIPVFAVEAGASLARPPSAGYDELFSGATAAADIAAVGRTAIERRRLQRMTGIVGDTDAVREVLERVVQIAPVAATVLITGESGTGKELVARGIHQLSPRKHRPFIAVNVAALSDTLLESELFGHEKGAFTGAVDSRRGLFELAHKGTIFLDEIGEMPVTTQTKLLRVLEQREFHRVGGESSIKVDVRIIAATNQDLRQLVAVGGFRRDLYFRLNVLHIALPPLRERREDIDLLVAAFVGEAAERHDRPFPGISPEAMDILRAYAWPGNIRELKNLVESMVVLSPGRVIEPRDIPEDVRTGGGRGLLPAFTPRETRQRSGSEGAVSDMRPELEFIFRTLVEMRVDMDELRREFESYRSEAGLGGNGYPTGGRHEIPVGSLPGRSYPSESGSVGVPDDDDVVLAEWTPGGDDVDAGSEGEQGVVVYRHGMTMEDIERDAIRAALDAVDGNRRRAAELLDIGERTLYRKISKYGLEG